MVPLLRALLYVPLCFGVKSLVRAIPYTNYPLCISNSCFVIPVCRTIMQIMTIDDILDQDVDIMVERTKYRALPRKAISLQRAWLFFGLQCAVGVWAATQFLSSTA